MYVNATFPSSKNSNLFKATLVSSKHGFVVVCKTRLYISDTFTPFFKSDAANSNVSAVTPEYLNPPVSVIIPVSKHVPISLLNRTCFIFLD